MQQLKFRNFWRLSKIIDKINNPHQHLLGPSTCHKGLVDTVPEGPHTFLWSQLRPFSLIVQSRFNLRVIKTTKRAPTTDVHLHTSPNNHADGQEGLHLPILLMPIPPLKNKNFCYQRNDCLWVTSKSWTLDFYHILSSFHSTDIYTIGPIY